MHADRFLFGKQQVRQAVTVEILCKNAGKAKFRVERKISEGAIVHLSAKQEGAGHYGYTFDPLPTIGAVPVKKHQGVKLGQEQHFLAIALPIHKQTSPW